MKTRWIIPVAAIAALAATTSFGDDITPRDLLQKVEAAYQAMQTYKTEGSVTADTETFGTKVHVVTSFSILLKKPNLYLISWAPENMPFTGMTSPGVVWSDGSQSYLYRKTMNAYTRFANDTVALGGAAAFSGGATSTITSLFLPALQKQSGPFSRLRDPKIEKIEKLGNDECYVLSGQSAVSKKETYWISKTSYVIRKFQRSLEPPAGGRVMPEMTDEQLEEAIKSTGQEVTEERKKNVREMMSKLGSMINTWDIKGSSVEFHEHVSFPKLDQTDFRFALPEGAVLKDSPFAEMFGENKEVSNKASN